ncbi:MAG TPA: phosphotransferase [Bacteroidales bacterium]|nr:phosphotransferase [Bacteroidales bacterium]
MIKEELLRLLFREFTGESPDSVTFLPKSGSDRIYCRLSGKNLSVLGVWNPDRKENDAFTGFAGSFRQAGLRVPEVYKYIPDEMVYLAEDLGDTDLFSWVKARKKEPDYVTAVTEMYRGILDELLRFQFDADAYIDYNLCHPRKKFDRSSVMWDLNYFKYMFLRLTKTGFNEELLEDDFNRLAGKAESYWSDAFLYRDFQSRNIMIFKGNAWFIDFQGGRKGAPYYDAASLLLDPYVELEGEIHDELAEYYRERLRERSKISEPDFYAAYRIFGIIRLCQALGAYGFRGLHEKKPNFTSSIPPAVRQLRRLITGKSHDKDFPELIRVSEVLSEKWSGEINKLLPD